MTTKYNRVRDLVARETFWSRGISHPWEGDALTTPWFLDRLAFLASHAPAELIEDLIIKCAEAP
jgi:hypothetical protein